ncbi:unnamed protein product [Psylliodes chrysocephalus]|uniref:Uncharacterized protein n=1 Tax=Psylliodes chrysocephalus TaxID=3402493 RepID=A0A9P0G8K4_9CUCU|nr:unnamed protein product [Psylliodes chrysocephala]
MGELTNSQLFEKLLKEIKEQGDKIKESIKLEIKTENERVITKLDNTLGRINVLEKNCLKIENKCLQLDRLNRKNNVLIFGLDVPNNGNLIDVVLHFFHRILEVQVSVLEINNIYKINAGRNGAINVEFVSYLRKQLIIRNCNKLKDKNIYIVQDLCYEDRQNQKILKKHLNIARTKKYNARIQGHYLVVNDEKFTAEQLRDKEEEQEEEEEEQEQEQEQEKVNCKSTEEKSLSAPQTPSQIGYFEDSIRQFVLTTPSSTRHEFINKVSIEEEKK